MEGNGKTFKYLEMDVESCRQCPLQRHGVEGETDPIAWNRFVCKKIGVIGLQIIRDGEIDPRCPLPDKLT